MDSVRRGFPSENDPPSCCHSRRADVVGERSNLLRCMSLLMAGTGNAGRIERCPVSGQSGKHLLPVSISGYDPEDLHYSARSAELRREILKLRETIFHGEYSLGIVHVDPRGVFERRQCGREYVHQSQRRVIGH